MDSTEMVLLGRHKRPLEEEGGQLTKRTRCAIPTNSYIERDRFTEDDTICYGMLADDIVQLKRQPTDKQAKAIEAQEWQNAKGTTFYSVVVDLQDEPPVGIIRATEHDERDTSAENKRDLGVLSNQTFRALKIICDIHDASFKPLLHSDEWKEKLDIMRGKGYWGKIAVNMKLNLILFGPRCASIEVARILATENRFLQNPIAGTFSELPYENPQSLILPAVQDFGTSEIGLGLRTDDQEEDTDNGAQQMSTEFDIDTLLNSIPSHDYLSLAAIHSHVVTKLLSHQQKAVDFIMRREGGEYVTDRSLWRRIAGEDDEDCYQHEITGAKSPTPDDCLGGIIADDMGLGKTLSMLSAIINSMNTANLFARHGGDGVAKSTIVIVPSELLLRTWSNELNKHLLPGTLSSVVYHGTDRRQYDESLSTYDIILTTYGTAMAELRKDASVLYQKRWYRLVLDEAHAIRNASSKQFQAVNKIQSHIRWCLSGTPIQNSLDDLGSLVRFLAVPVLDNTAIFSKHISGNSESRKKSREPFKNLRLLLGSICLRRTMGALPSMGFTVLNHVLEFTRAEREQYVSLELCFERLISLAINKQGDIGKLKVMEVLLRLRMFCNNGFEGPLQGGVPTQRLKPDEVFSVLQQSGEAICASCSCDVQSVNGLEDSENGYLTRCFRVFCHECSLGYQEAFRQRNTPTCSLCQRDHGVEGFVGNDSDELVLRSPPLCSTKVEALVSDVQAYYLKGKCVIFSFWKRTLDVVAKSLRHKQIKFDRIDGDVTPKRRNAILTKFQIQESSRVLIMTFSTGGVGLNGLTVANRIHILEPQWNPAVEKQAIGRVVRLDQANRVTVVRYVMSKTIEQSVQSQQHRKLEIAGGGFATDRDQGDLKANQLRQLGSLLAHTTRPMAVMPVIKP
ncbi:SNF2 family N-terminal domain-containing protein [Cladorrhinum sp. PSN259]|nr:SNF2 family N-terminal domain-containing protein [Cladorrhinum sp. PSN259]